MSLLLSISAALSTAGEPAGEVVRGELGARLDAYLERLEAHGYSGTVLVADREGIALEKGYGMADRERGIPAAADTVVSFGSITKQFTGAAILKLDLEGRLSVDDALLDHFDDVPEDKAAITLHDLLIHGSGLRSDFGGDYDPIGREEYVRRALESELLFEPGTGYAYSNAGYSLLAAVIEQVTGRTYEEHLREELFLPAGMRDTGYLLPEFADERLARGYDEDGLWGTLLERPMAADGPYWALRGNGGIHSTVGDMYRWHLALAGDELFTPEAKELLYGRHNPEGGGTCYGYGWSIGDTEDGLLVAHDGGNRVFVADFLRFLDAGVVAVMTSSSAAMPATRFSEAVASLAFGHDVPQPPALVTLAPEELAACAGTYVGESGEQLEVAVGWGALELAAADPGAAALLFGPAPPAGSPGHRLMQRSLAALEAAAAGRFEPLAEALDADPAGVGRREGAAWSELRTALGEYRGAAPLGTGQPGPEVQVHVRLDFERGQRFARLAWEDGQLVGLAYGERAPRRVVRPESKSGFLEHDFESGRTWRMRFELDERGAPRAALLRGAAGEVRLARAP
jgi:CubicO group peptidase (beta-lactamase class C family)